MFFEAFSNSLRIEFFNVVSCFNMLRDELNFSVPDEFFITLISLDILSSINSLIVSLNVDLFGYPPEFSSVS